MKWPQTEARHVAISRPGLPGRSVGFTTGERLSDAGGLTSGYGVQRGLEVAEAASRVIFYYGKCSIKKPFCLTAEELDDHFGWPVRDAVERLNEYYRQKLFHLLMNFQAP